LTATQLIPDLYFIFKLTEMNETNNTEANISPQRNRAKTISSPKEYSTQDQDRSDFTPDGQNSEKPFQLNVVKNKSAKNAVRWSSPAIETKISQQPATQTLNNDLVQEQTRASVDKIAEYFRAELLSKFL